MLGVCLFVNRSAVHRPYRLGPLLAAAMKALLVAALLCSVTVPVLAEDELAFVTPDDAVPAHPDRTYAELLRQLIPDFRSDGTHWTGTLPGTIRHIDGGEVGETPAISVSYLDIRVLDGGGKKNIWVMADLGDGGRLGTYTLLAVFDAETLKLLDGAEVDSDQLTGFIDQPLRISPQDEAVLVDTEHSNSSQTYQSETLLFMKDGRLTVVDDFFAFGTRDCTSTQYEMLNVTAQPNGDRYWPITAVVTRQTANIPETDDSGCQEPMWKDFRFKDFAAVYTWDGKAKRYVTTSTELDELAATDSALF